MATITTIAANVLKYAKGGAMVTNHGDWSYTTGRKQIKFRWEVKNLQKAAKENGVEYTEIEGGFQLVYTDTMTDTEYCVIYQRSPYIGRPDHVIAQVTNNVSIANQE